MSLKKGKMLLNVEEYMHKWNLLYPMDRWWRLKHGIPFGSRKHLEANFIDMLFELREDLFFLKLKKEYGDHDPDLEFNEEEKELLQIKPHSKEEVKMSKREVDNEFANLDLSQFNDKQDG